MLKRPLVPRIPRPVPKRLPAKHRMTIAVGFCRGYAGVLCADSYESVQGYYKATVSKLKTHSFRSASGRGEGGTCALAAAGPANLCDALYLSLYETFKERSWQEEWSQNIEIVREVVQKFYENHMWPNPNRPDMSALVVLHDSTKTLLLRTADSTLTSEPYASIGIGTYVADHWRQLVMPAPQNAGSLAELVSAAAYLVWQAKETVDGCGGHSDLLVFAPNGRMRVVGDLSAMEDVFRKIHNRYGRLVRDLLYTAQPTHAVERFRADLISALIEARDAYKSLDTAHDGLI